MQALPNSNKPRGRKGGRKATNKAPKDKRTEQIRISQRNFRERQKERLSDLEQKEKELEVFKRDNVRLKAENEILSSLMRGCKSTDLSFPAWVDSCKVPSENNNLCNAFSSFNSRQVLEFSIKTEFFRQLLSVCGGKRCITLPLEDDDIYRENNGHGIVPQEYLISNRWSPMFKESPLLEGTINQMICDLSDIEVGSIINTSLLTSSIDPFELLEDQRYKAPINCPAPSCRSVLDCNNLLSASDIWYFLKTNSWIHILDLDNLIHNIKREAFCYNEEVTITLDSFLEVILTSSKMERNNFLNVTPSAFL